MSSNSRPPPSLASQFAHRGYAIVHDAVDHETVDALLRNLQPLTSNAGRRGGVRHLLRGVPAVRDFASILRLHAQTDFLQPHLLSAKIPLGAISSPSGAKKR